MQQIKFNLALITHQAIIWLALLKSLSIDNLQFTSFITGDC